MHAAATREVRVPQRDRPKDHQTTQVVFRCPEEVLEAAKAMGHRYLTTAILELLDQALATRAALGVEGMAEVRARAAREDGLEGQAIGKVMGELALESLEKKGGKR